MPDRELGSASMLVVMLLGVLALVGVAAQYTVAVGAAHRAAQAAADLAALAGAAQLQRGGEPCGAAGDVAAENQALLTTCQVGGEEVWVEVTVRSPQWAGYRFEIDARAHAGAVR